MFLYGDLKRNAFASVYHRYEDLLQVKWQVYPDFHIPDVMEPQPHRMQERAAASWRSFDSASIEWLPVAADFTCSR